MDKMRMESIDMTAQNIEKIGVLFPNCITETLGNKGEDSITKNKDGPAGKQFVDFAVLEYWKSHNSKTSRRGLGHKNH